MSYAITTDDINLDQLSEIVNSDRAVTLSDHCEALVTKCRDYLNHKMAGSNEPVYGINTGFGSLCNTSISEEDLGQLQQNLVMSHACGLGDEVPTEIVRLMLLLKARGLAYGHSGAAATTIQRLLDFYNHGVHPNVFELGSLGASGDLAPLAHLSLPLLGLGEVEVNGERRAASEVLKEKGWEPIALQSKEGLALLNGTQFMSAYGTWNLMRLRKLMDWADVIGALSLEAFDGRIEPFLDPVHLVRKQPGQLAVARNIRSILEGSELITQKKVHVQDPYSFRCMPQVHGATRDALAFVEQVFVSEINSVTDNPTVFPDEDLIISAGNFHGQPLALAADQMAIAAAELASISERRVYKLIGGDRGLPPFLVANPGLNSGFMIPQYTAASIVSQNKQLATPASVDSIESSNGQEDHVSMGANGATKARRVVQNLERVLAIELFNASQALQFRRPAKTSPFLEKVVDAYRQTVPFVDDDKIMHAEIEKSVTFLQTFDLKLP